MRVYAFAAALVAGASLGCGCTPSVGNAKTGSVSGVVLKGPVEGATVTAFSVNGAGRRAAQLGVATTDETGAFKVDIGDHAGPTLLCAAAGRFQDEASAALVQVGPIELCRLVDNVDLGSVLEGVTVTPWTSLHAELSSCFVELDRDSDLASGSSHAAFRLNDFLGAGLPGYDLLTTVPTDVTTATGLSLSPEAWAGLLSAGLSQTSAAQATENDATPGVRFTAITLADKLREDLAAGCIFDGVGGGGTQLAEGTVELSADTLRSAPRGLATSIAAFLGGDRNSSGITTEDVQDLLRRLADHRSELFADSTNLTDLDKPVVTFVAPEAGTTIGGSIRVTARAVDASRIVEFAFTAPDQAAFVASAVTCADDTATDCTITGTLNTNLAPVVDGPLDILARAVDAAGNPTTQTLSIVVNNTLPSIQVTAPQDEQPVAGVFQINATASDTDGIASLTVEIPGVGLCDGEPTSPCRDIQPDNTLLQVAWDTTTMPEGNVTLLFRAVDAAGQEAEQEVTVLVDNSDIGAITGSVDLGAPVRGATVTALVWTGRLRGAVLGTAVTDALGQYRVNLDDGAHPSVLVVVTGGSFVDLATALPLNLGVSDELTAAVGAIQEGEVRTVNVNAWTTLAASRALHTPAVSDDAFAIQQNHLLISRHLRRPPGAIFDVSGVLSADLTAGLVTIDNATAVLALSHAGLSRFAAEASIRAGLAVGTINVANIITTLTQDLRFDPLLDGRGAGGAVLTFGPALEQLTSFTTRFEIAASLDRWIREVPLDGANVDRNNSGITRTDAIRALLLRDLAEDEDLSLYPEGEPSRPFDVSPPSLVMSFQDGAFGRPFGEPLRGTVFVAGRATDAEASVSDAFATLDGINPLPDQDTALDAFRVSADTSVLPNAATAVTTCSEATPQSITAAAALDSPVCFCGVAEDQNENIGQTLLCFTRPAPTVNTTSPTSTTVVNSTASTLLQVTATSGFDLASCVAAISNPSEPTPPPLNAAVRSGPNCTFQETIVPGALSDGRWSFSFTASDITGRSATQITTFTVDTTPPDVEISAPNDGDGDNQTTITVRGFVQGTGDVASVTVSFSRGAGSVVVPLQLNATTWQANVTLNAGLSDGPITITARAADVNGNTQDDTSTYILDRTLPVLTAVAVQPTVVDYDSDQPLSSSGLLVCPPSGPCVDRRPLIIGGGARRIPNSSIFSGGTPTEPIVRWATMLDDLKDAPSFDIEIADQNVLEVLYSIDATCNNTPNNKATLFLPPNHFRMPMIQAVSTVPLSTQTGTTNLCLSIVGVDVAGNRSAVTSRNIRWKTIGAPATVTSAPSSFNTVGRTYPGGFRDAQTFAGRSLRDWAAGQSQYVVYHAFVHNPHTSPIRFRPSFSGSGLANMDLSAFVRTNETWSTASSTALRFTQSVAGGTLPLRNPCNTNRGSTIDTSTSPVYVDTGGCGTVTPSPANIDLITSFTPLATRVQVGTSRFSSSVSLTPPTTRAATNRTEAVRSVVPLTTPVVYQLDGALEPTLQLTSDANQAFTIAPGGTLLVVMLASNSSINTNSNIIEIIDDTASEWTRLAPALNEVTNLSSNTLPPMSPTTAVLFREDAQTNGFNGVLVFHKNTSGVITATSDLACDDGECAIGTITNEVLHLTVNASNTSLTQSTFVGTTQSQWTSSIASPQLPSSTRCVPGLDASTGC